MNLNDASCIACNLSFLRLHVLCISTIFKSNLLVQNEKDEKGIVITIDLIELPLESSPLHSFHLQITDKRVGTSQCYYPRIPKYITNSASPRIRERPGRKSMNTPGAGLNGEQVQHCEK